MAKNMQTHFNQFHQKIKLDNFNENKNLREKRDIILQKLRDGLKKQFEDKEETTPKYQFFNQGSYAMSTGIAAIKGGDYDIDVGLSFHLSKEDYPNPTVVKKWVYEALKDHTNRVEIKRPCVRVVYFKNGEEVYHVDLAIYSDSEHNDDSQTYLAKGHLGSGAENKIWEISEPQKLIKKVQEHFQDIKDRDQFRRVIRYLKRWKDFKFSSKGDGKPTGIALTVAALKWFSPSKTIDPFNSKCTYDDLEALYQFVNQLTNQFILQRLRVDLPIQPYNDLLELLTDKHMEIFKSKLENFQQVLKQAIDETDIVEACEVLSKEFGDDFPVPDKEETAQKKRLAITTTSSSA